MQPQLSCLLQEEHLLLGVSVKEEGGEGRRKRGKEEERGRRREEEKEEGGEKLDNSQFVISVCCGFTIPPAYCCVTCPLEHWEQFTMMMSLLQAACSSSRRLVWISGMLPAPNVCNTTPCIGGWRNERT